MVTQRSTRLVTTVAIAICLFGALLRLPAIAQPLGIDEGIFSAAAWGMSHGGVIYRDLWDQKPPGIHLLYRAAFTLIGWRESTVFWLDYLAFIATTAGLVIVGRRLVDQTWGWYAAAIYAILGLPLIRFGYGGFLERAVPETFIPLFALAAAILMLRPVPATEPASTATRPAPAAPAAPTTLPLDPRTRATLIGVCIGTAALFKPTALIYWPMLWLTAPLVGPTGAAANHAASASANHSPVASPHRPTLLLRGRTALYSLLGVAAPMALCVLWFWHLNVLDDARAAIFDYNRAYVAVGFQPLPFASRFIHEVWRLTKSDPLWMPGMIGLVFSLITWAPRARRYAAHGTDRATPLRAAQPPSARDRAALLSTAWLIAALIAAAANGARFYPTYFMPCLVPLSLLAATLLPAPAQQRARHDRHDRYRVISQAIPVAALALIIIRFAPSPLPTQIARAIADDFREWHASTASPAASAAVNANDTAALTDANGAPASANVTRAAARLHYLENFESRAKSGGYSARANEELSAWLTAHSDPHDRIYIFGMAPAVYFTSQRLPAQRFLWIGPAASNLIPRPDYSLEAVASDLERTQPRYIIEEHNNRDGLLGWRVEDKFNDPSMRQVLTHYDPILQIEDFSIYARRKP